MAADPEGVQWVRSNPLPLKYPMKMKKNGLSNTNLFYFHGIFRKNEKKSSKQTPHLFMNPPNEIHALEPPLMPREGEVLSFFLHT